MREFFPIKLGGLVGIGVALFLSFLFFPSTVQSLTVPEGNKVVEINSDGTQVKAKGNYASSFPRNSYLLEHAAKRDKAVFESVVNGKEPLTAFKLTYLDSPQVLSLYDIARDYGLTVAKKDLLNYLPCETKEKCANYVSSTYDLSKPVSYRVYSSGNKKVSFTRIDHFKDSQQTVQVERYFSESGIPTLNWNEETPSPVGEVFNSVSFSFLLGILVGILTLFGSLPLEPLIFPSKAEAR